MMSDALRKAAEQALLILGELPSHDMEQRDRQGKAWDALRAALAEPTSPEYALGYAEGFNDACKPKPEQPEHVTNEENERFSQDVSNFKGADPEATKYALEQFLKNRAAPPRRKPLTEDKMWELWNAQGDDEMDQAAACAFARAVEQYHGIGGKDD